MRERPAPTWMPFTTGIGTTRENQDRRPVMLRSRTIVETVIPAAAVSWMLNCLLMATAAIAFIGCTGRGRPNMKPVAMFARPVNTRVLGRDTEWVRVRAMRRGRSVPRSPRDPESSESGWERIVWRLCARERLRRVRRVIIH